MGNAADIGAPANQPSDLSFTSYCVLYSTLRQRRGRGLVLTSEGGLNEASPVEAGWKVHLLDC